MIGRDKSQTYISIRYTRYICYVSTTSPYEFDDTVTGSWKREHVLQARRWIRQTRCPCPTRTLGCKISRYIVQQASSWPKSVVETRIRIVSGRVHASPTRRSIGDDLTYVMHNLYALRAFRMTRIDSAQAQHKVNRSTKSET